MAADEEPRSVGNVAEEAARLVDAFTTWAGEGSGSAPRPDSDAPGSPAEEDLGGVSGAGASERPGAGDAGSSCPECGAARGGVDTAVCRVCPVCQGLALLRSIRPETVDRLADLAGAVADSLRAMAHARREDGAGPTGGTAAPPTQDIPVTEDDDPDDETSDEGARA